MKIYLSWNTSKSIMSIVKHVQRWEVILFFSLLGKEVAFGFILNLKCCSPNCVVFIVFWCRVCILRVFYKGQKIFTSYKCKAVTIVSQSKIYCNIKESFWWKPGIDWPYILMMTIYIGCVELAEEKLSCRRKIDLLLLIFPLEHKQLIVRAFFFFLLTVFHS